MIITKSSKFPQLILDIAFTCFVTPCNVIFIITNEGFQLFSRDFTTCSTIARLWLVGHIQSQALNLVFLAEMWVEK